MAERSFDEIASFDDYAVGDRFVTPPLQITQANLDAFVAEHGPLPLEAYRGRDPALPKEVFPDFPVLGLCFAHMIRSGFIRGHGMSSPGLDALSFPDPVRPGETVRVELEVVEARPSGTRADRGYTTFDVKAVSARETVLVAFRVVEVVERRPET